jgi:Predicted hydrolases or acyltransferases (alpha/beta hydrolase superfamily)
VPEVVTDDVTLHVEVDGAGEPVTVFAHGLTNSCMELAAFTPFAPGTKVRFCFRGHGHSGTPPADRFGFADFARDLDAVARAYGATNAVGTSLGAGAMTHLLSAYPDRFDRLVFLLPAALDIPIGDHSMFDRTAELLETMPKEEAIETALRESGRSSNYDENPGLRDFDLLLWQDMNPVGVARAIRGVTRDVAIGDRERLRAVTAPALIIAREGDAIHPAELGRVMAELMPNAELLMLASEEELMASIPALVQRVSSFLAGDR